MSFDMSSARGQEMLALLDAIFTDAPAGLAFLDADLRYLRVNETLAAMNGVGASVHLGRTVREIIPLLSDTLEPILRRVISTGESAVNIEIKASPGADLGPPRYWLASYYPVWAAEPERRPIGLWAVVVDNTDRKLSEQALHESEERYRSLVHATSEIVWTTAGDGSNGQAPNWTNITGQEMNCLEEGWLASVHPDDRERAIQVWAEALRDKIFNRNEFRLRHADGNYYFYAVHGVPIFGEDGTVREWVGTCTNITERKRAEQRLRESEALFHTMADTAPVMIWMSGADTLCTYFNQPWLDFRGRGAAQEAGAGWTEGVHPEDLEQCLDTYRTAFDTRAAFSMEYRLQRHDGAYRWIVDIGVPRFATGGEFLGYIGSCIDITERKLAEEELRVSRESLSQLSQRLESAREEESRRIARELHDELGQSLTGIIINLSWIEGKLFDWGEDVPARQPLLAKSRDTLKLANSTVETVRRIATELRPGLLDDFGLFAAIEWHTHEFQRRTGIVCQLKLATPQADFSPRLSTAMFRIFQEALTNVVRHSQAATVTVTMEEQNRRLVMRVRDDGLGADEAALAAPQALGILGMKERARLVGGEVSVTAERGVGTTVTASLPLSDSLDQ